MHRIHAFLFVLVACLAISSTGEAQIYSWLDANGTLVISNEALPPDARTLIAGGTTSMGTPVTATPDGAGRYDALIRRHASNYGTACGRTWSERSFRSSPASIRALDHRRGRLG